MRNISVHSMNIYVKLKYSKFDIPVPEVLAEAARASTSWLGGGGGGWYNWPLYRFNPGGYHVASKPIFRINKHWIAMKVISESKYPF